MGSDITADSCVTIPEASAALELPAEVLASLTNQGPFCADAGGLTMREAFAAALSLMLPFPVSEAVPIAITAAQGAEVGGGRSLMLLWPTTHQIAPFWITAADKRPPMPRLEIPADEMMTLFAVHLTAARQGAARPN